MYARMPRMRSLVHPAHCRRHLVLEAAAEFNAKAVAEMRPCRVLDNHAGCWILPHEHAC